MANTAAAFGFQHIGYLPGAAPDYAPTRRMIQSSYATSIFFGDPVLKSSASPYIKVFTAAASRSARVAAIFRGRTNTPKVQGAPVSSPCFPGAAPQPDPPPMI